MKDPHSDKPVKDADLTELSDEDVEARIGVRTGRSPRAPIAPPTRTRRPRAQSGTFGWRGSLALLGGLVLAFLGLRYLQSGLPGAAGAPATFGGVALGSVSPTLAPGETLVPGKTVGPIVDPSLDLAATPNPEATPTPAVPTPTLAPGATPRPTVAGGKTPTPNPSPTTAVATATLTVVVKVINDNGGTATPGLWTVTVSGAGASPASFPGSASGTTVTLRAGQSYAVTDAPRPGYGTAQSGNCNSAVRGVLVAGGHYTCTISHNDQPATVTVVLHVTNDNGGGAVASDWLIQVTGANASPSSFSGSESGTSVLLDADATYTVENPINGPSNYSLGAPSAGCSGNLALGQTTTCTFTENDTGPAAPVGGGSAWPLIPLLPLRRRPLQRRRRPA